MPCQLPRPAGPLLVELGAGSPECSDSRVWALALPLNVGQAPCLLPTHSTHVVPRRTVRGRRKMWPLSPIPSQSESWKRRGTVVMADKCVAGPQQCPCGMIPSIQWESNLVSIKGHMDETSVVLPCLEYYLARKKRL